MALKMKFLETSPINAEDQIRYPVSYANGIFLRDGTRTVQDFIDSFNVNNGGDNSINLPSNCVNTSQINDLAITSEKIAASAIIEGKIADNAITDAKVTAYNKQSQIGGLSGSKLKDNAVTEDKIADDAVTTDKIVDGAVTLDKAAFGQVELISVIAAGDYTFSNVSSANQDRTGWLKADVTGYRVLFLGVGQRETNYSTTLATTAIFPIDTETTSFFTRYTEIVGEYAGYSYIAKGELEFSGGKTYLYTTCVNYANNDRAVLYGIK